MKPKANMTKNTNQKQKKVFIPDLPKLAKHKERELAHYKELGVREGETYIQFLYRKAGYGNQ